MAAPLLSQKWRQKQVDYFRAMVLLLPLLVLLVVNIASSSSSFSRLLFYSPLDTVLYSLSLVAEQPRAQYTHDAPPFALG